jgi:Ca2+-binding EF-hand superfamily protein
MNNLLSNETLIKLNILLSDLSEGEKDVEISRIILNENFDFDPYKLFKYLDRKNNNKISIDDIIYYMNMKKKFISNSEAKKLISFYDEDFDGQLNYLEFINLIQSSSKILFVNGNLYNNNNNNFSISENIEYCFINLLDKELNLIRRILLLIEDIKKQFDFSIKSCFDILKSWTCITSDGLDKFFCNIVQKHYEKNSNFIRNIIKRLDINKDGKIDMKEFSIFFTVNDENSQTENSQIENFNYNYNNNFTDFLTEKKFYEFIHDLMDIEEKLENLKIDLALRNDFNIENIFRYFDYDHKGFILPSDLNLGLKNLQLNINKFDINLLFKKYDFKMKGQLNYCDLFDMLTPFQNDYRNMIENRKPIEGEFMLSTKIIFVNLIKNIIWYENKINNMRIYFNTVRKRIREIFARIDKNNKGYFDFNDWEYYLKKMKNFVNNNKENNNKFNLNFNESFIGKNLVFIRLDKKRMGKVDYIDLIDELTPIENKFIIV